MTGAVNVEFPRWLTDETLRQILHDNFRTGEPGEMEAIETASKELAAAVSAECTNSQQLVARIKRSSKYWGQTEPNRWFDVRIVEDHYYQLRGNSNNYSVGDVAMGVRLSDGSVLDFSNGKTFAAHDKAGAR